MVGQNKRARAVRVVQVALGSVPNVSSPHCTVLTGKSEWISIRAFVTWPYGILAFSRFRNPLAALIEELFA